MDFNSWLLGDPLGSSGVKAETRSLVGGSQEKEDDRDFCPGQVCITYKILS